MYVRSIWQCKHDHQKGANTHNLVSLSWACLVYFFLQYSKVPLGVRVPLLENR